MSRPLPAADRDHAPALSGEGSLLAASIDASQTRLCLLESIGGVYRLAAWSADPRLGDRHLGAELAGACRRLGKRLGRRLWDEEAQAPFLNSRDPVRFPPIEQLALSLNPLPPLRIRLAGLSDGYSLAAAQRATAAGNVEVIGAETLTITANHDRLAQTLRDEQPDAMILTGGYDHPDPLSFLPYQQLATWVGNALLTLPEPLRPLVILAGNRHATPPVQAMLQTAGLDAVVIPNVMPSPGIIRHAPLVRALDALAQHLARSQDGYRLLEQWHTSPAPVAGAEANFIRVTQVWRELYNLTDLHAVYTGARRVHVWSAEGRDGAVVVTTTVEEDPPTDILGWPPIHLISGPWPDDLPAPATTWWDRHGLAPVVAALAPAAPAATLQVLTHDLLLPPP